MIRNRSVPTDAPLAHLFYNDVAKAAQWLSTTFGFVEHYRYGEPVQGAQMRLSDTWIMLGISRSDRSSPATAGVRTQMLSVFVEDIDAHYQRCMAAGCRIVEDLRETTYGERQFVAEDIEGHHWLFSRHARDVSPVDWGATIATST